MLEQWVKDSVVQLSFVEEMPSQANKKDAVYWPYHHRKGYALEQYVSLRRISNKKLQAREIIFQNKRDVNVHEQHPFQIMAMVEVRDM